MTRKTETLTDTGAKYEKEAYLKQLEEELRKQAGDGGKLVYRDVTKNNGVVRRSVSIVRDGATVSPVIYLDTCYDAYLKCGQTAQETAAQILHDQAYADYVQEKAEVFFGSYDGVKEQLSMKAVNLEKNRSLLPEVPHLIFEDLAVLYYYTVLGGQERNGTVRISRDDLERWEVTEEDFIRDAEMSSRAMFPPVIRGVREMLGFPGPEEELFVLTNTRGVFGAACLFYPGMTDEILERFGKSCYILPSSIHEVLILPESPDCDPQALRTIVREINRTEVLEEDFLSDSVYLLDIRSGSLRRL